MKRFLSLCLTAALLLSILLTGMLGITANAVEIDAGTCGDGLTWTIDGDGKLTISGEGSMTDFGSISVPWENYRDVICEVEITDGVTSVGAYAFYNCTGLTDVSLPDSVTAINKAAFYKCRSLTAIVIPDKVSTIGDNAFWLCDSLTEIMIPNAVTSIGAWSFYGCTGLTEITIPSNVTSIGDAAFGSCSGLTSITIPNSITSIGANTFLMCLGLNSITLPDSITTIGSGAFRNCFSLTDVWYVGDEAAKNKIEFSTDNDPLTSAKWHYNACPAGEDHTYSDSCDTTCNVCDFSRTAPHNYQWIVDRETTCAVAGIKHEECSICNTKRSENTEIPATGQHNYQWIIDKPANCGVSGSMHEECIGCGFRPTGNIGIYIAPTGEHVFDSVCDRVCEVCNYNRIVSHDYQWIIDKPAGCGFNGVGHEECSICNTKRNENTVISATGKHSYDDVCDAVCNVCKYQRTAPHNYLWLIDKQSTCGFSGIKHEECSGCSMKRNENTVIPATGEHSFTDNSDLVCNSCSQIYYPIVLISYDDVVYSISRTEPGSTYTVPSDTPTRNGYNFVGWAITKNGNAKYQPNGTLSINKSMTLYAQWNKRCTICGGDKEIGCETCGATGKESYTCGSCGGEGGQNITCSNCNGYGGICNYCGNGAPLLKACPYCKNNQTSAHDCPKCTGGSEGWRTCSACSGNKKLYKKCSACQGEKSKNCNSCNAQGEVIRVNVSAPDAPVLVSVDSSAVVLRAISNGEYSINGTTWQDSPTFQNLESGKAYNFYQRYAKTDAAYASESSAALSVLVHQHTYDSDCDAVCNLCDYSRAVPDHIYDNECDTECNICEQSRTTSHVYDNACDNVCNECGSNRSVPDHIYDNACDPTCNECSLVREAQHVYDNACDCVCNGCEFVRAVPDHVYDNENDRECNECGFVAYIPGDMDLNGALETDDAVYLLLYVMFGAEDYPVESDINLDFDGSGKVSTDDAVYLLLHVMFGAEDYPLAV